MFPRKGDAPSGKSDLSVMRAQQAYNADINRRRQAKAAELAEYEAACLRTGVRYIKDFIAANSALFKAYREQKGWR